MKAEFGENKPRQYFPNYMLTNKICKRCGSFMNYGTSMIGKQMVAEFSCSNTGCGKGYEVTETKAIRSLADLRALHAVEKHGFNAYQG